MPRAPRRSSGPSLLRGALLALSMAGMSAAGLNAVSCGGGGGSHATDAAADRAPSSDGPTEAGDLRPDLASDHATSTCPSARPSEASACDAPDPCLYGPATCTCVDPGPNGHWQCQSGDVPDASNAAACPPDEPQTGDPCTTEVEHCLYPDYACDCVPSDGWTCFI